MTTLTLNGLPLDEGSFLWPIYRGTEPREIHIYGMGERWAEYAAIAPSFLGGPGTIRIVGTKDPGALRGSLATEIKGVYVSRMTRVNEQSVVLHCYDGRLLLARAVNALDFNMTFGDGFLPGTEYPTYRQAIVAFMEQLSEVQPYLAPDCYASVPDRPLESNVHVSALLAPDPLAYLCDRAGVDLVIGLDGLWYFASREDATTAWFAGYESYNWAVRPAFLALESVVLQRPRTIISYYWEEHCIRAEATDDGATVSSYGPDSTQVELEQVYEYNGTYYTMAELLEELDINIAMPDRSIAAAYFRDKAFGSSLHPVDTRERKIVWAAIRRDWRRLYRIKFPNGNTGGWDNWRFGKLNADGSVDPTSVETAWIEFKNVVRPDNGATIVGSPWTFNRSDQSPFKAVWDDGPESGVIRFLLNEARSEDAYPPLPGVLSTPHRPTDGQLRIVEKDGLANEQGLTEILPELVLPTREDLTLAQVVPSHRAYVYLVGRRFMPNDTSRWHARSEIGYSDGDIPQVALPPSDEVYVYRTFVVAGDPSTQLADGLGLILNEQEVADDAARRAEVWRISHTLSTVGEGSTDTAALAMRTRVVDGPVHSVDIDVSGVVVKTVMRVGNLADNKARMATAARRMATRKVLVQGSET